MKSLQDVLDTNPEHALETVERALSCTNFEPLLVSRSVPLPPGAGRKLKMKREEIAERYMERDELLNSPNLHIVDHPMLRHKMTLARSITTDSDRFFRLVGEISSALIYEATRHLPVREVPVTTPICEMHGYEIAGKKPVIAIIMRAGLGGYFGVRNWLPASKTAVLGMSRNEATLLPDINYVKMPKQCEGREVFLIDPMLATGVSAVAATEVIKAFGAKKITFISLLAAPQGVNSMALAHPDVPCYTAALDVGLDKNGFIVGGLGDCGDKLFGVV